MKTKLGITCYQNTLDSQNYYTVGEKYIKAILDQGAIPVIIPADEDCSSIGSYVGMVDGLLIPGGEDVSPLQYGEEPHPSVTLTKSVKDVFEAELILQMHQKGKPVLGICRGMQIINVAFGGTLIQDIPSEMGEHIEHKQAMGIRSEATHTVKIAENSLLYPILGKQARVNSYHHQAIKAPASGFRVTAQAQDGIIEALESNDGKVFAVQWHPECLYERYTDFSGIFRKLVELSAR